MLIFSLRLGVRGIGRERKCGAIRASGNYFILNCFIPPNCTAVTHTLQFHNCNFAVLVIHTHTYTKVMQLKELMSSTQTNYYKKKTQFHGFFVNVTSEYRWQREKEKNCNYKIIFIYFAIVGIVIKTWLSYKWLADDKKRLICDSFHGGGDNLRD